MPNPTTMKITATVPMSHDHHVIGAVHLLFLPVRAGTLSVADPGRRLHDTAKLLASNLRPAEDSPGQAAPTDGHILPVARSPTSGGPLNVANPSGRSTESARPSDAGGRPAELREHQRLRVGVAGHHRSRRHRAGFA